MTTLAVGGLAKAFGGVQALRGVSFGVDAGEVVAMIGPNGAGKTTCFDILSGLLEPDAGAVEFDGRSVLGLAPRRIWRLGVGRTFQLTAAFGSMSVRENVQMALLSHHRRLWSFLPLAARAHVREADALLERAGIGALAAQPCAELAYGDLKRVELAMTLAHRPRLLLMDEPTAGMAPRERADLMALTARLARERRVGVLFTEHDMDAVFAHADHILVLVHGEIIARGTPAEVRANARVKQVYLGEMGAIAADRAARAGSAAP
jgi:branched-chain amino acid transport system ATP-binding protein